jgi:Protein of unknown function (DUF3313)
MMRKTLLHLLVIAGTLFSLGCTLSPSGPPTIESGPDAEITHDGLHRLDNTRRFQRVWVKPGLQLASYRKLLPVNSGIHYKRAPRSSRGEFPLTETQMERFRLGLRDAIEAELTGPGGWEMTNEKGPDVLIVRGAILDLVVTVPPQRTAGRSESYSTSVGEATLLVEIYDSESVEILARIVDRRAINRESSSFRNDTINNRAAARNLFRIWALRLRQGLDFAKTVEWQGDEAR